jgi:cyclase
MAIEAVKLDPQMTVYLGGGGNSVVLQSQDRKKAIVVDTKYFSGSRLLRQEVTASDITLINTHFHLDHARGNRLYPEALVVSGETNWRQWNFDTAHSKRPDRVLRAGEQANSTFDDETVRVVDLGRAHSPNDLIVLFEKRKVLVAGDLVWVNMHPVLLDGNTNVESWIGFLDKMEREYDIETVIPGHGAIAAKTAISEMKEYFHSIRQALGQRAELKRLKQKYGNYRTFLIFGSFHRTVEILRKTDRLKTRTA